MRGWQQPATGRRYRKSGSNRVPELRKLAGEHSSNDPVYGHRHECQQHGCNLVGDASERGIN